MAAKPSYHLHDSVGFWLHRVYTLMNRRFTAALAELEVTPEHWQVLIGLHSGKASTPLELAAYTGTDASTITRRVDQLQQRGLLTREPHPGDRRCLVLTLTPAGRRLVPKIAKLSKAANEEAMRTLPAAERQRLKRILVEMLANLEPPADRKT